jgi:hypothetical protein
VDGQSQLFQIVFALRTTSRFASLLDSGQEQSNQDRNDRNHNQQFNQGESTSTDHVQ